MARINQGGVARVAPAGVSEQAVSFLGRASALLAHARTAEPADRLTLSYQAALRVAGAVLAEHPGRRRKADQGAWARIRRHAPEYAGWAARFEDVSPVHEDLRLGFRRRVDELEARRVQAIASEFLAEVEADFGMLAGVA
ncbi:SAV_6107 family HEPN domain-containing protein [uncultured Corynebacterium sp.]|uniref:SAV_6107 family HEPN domain-containing protein n=1 Tax=uncultured Corynebacterium sp. TaxID=159447 RepID=UPI0025E0CE25|nr:SAV_6107 family HEPN domain-containing protein [uncultured Corynebacterium sp.]